MIDLLRFALAWVVVLSHYESDYGDAARLAVLGFYILAGLCNVGATQRYPNALSFFWRRYTRLWPIYAVVALVAFLRIGLPPDWFTGLQNALMAVPRSTGYRLVPQAWVFYWMLLLYLALGLGLGRTRRGALLWLAVSIAWSGWVWGGGNEYTWYFSLAHASFGFALGACLYHGGIRPQRGPEWTVPLGALSYPIFMSHLEVQAYLPLEEGWGLFWVAAPIVMGVSVALLKLDQVAQKWVSRIVL